MRPRVAMLAYACDPVGNGEHWLGWGWAEAASRFCDVTLFTPPKARAAIEKEASRLGIAVAFVEIPAWLRWCSERLGTGGLWWRKIAWAKRAAAAVRARLGDFDIVHQTTFHTFRVPFYAAELGIPSIWGPIAGGESAPAGFEEILGPEAAKSERKRDSQNRRWLRWGSVQRALRSTSAIFVSNRTTLQFLPKFAQSKAIVVPPNTVRVGETKSIGLRTARSGPLKLIYAGNCVATRGIPLVLRAIRGSADIKLTVVGGGTALEAWKREATHLGLGDAVEFTGGIPREQLLARYAESDALIFPALRDSGGSALLEAMSMGLPVVCLDWGGPGEMVDDASGIKIAVRSPEQVIADMKAAFAHLQAEPGLRNEIATNAAARVRECFTWDAKERILRETCERLLSHKAADTVERHPL